MITFKEFYYKEPSPKDKKKKKVRRYAAKRKTDLPPKFTDTNTTPLSPVDQNRGIRGDAAI